MAEDPSGEVWLGTQSGLNRFDGVDTQLYLPDQRGGGLANAWVTALVIDAQGDLWVGSLGGLDRYRRKHDNFESMSDPHGANGRLRAQMVNSLQLDRQGRLWVGHEHGVALWNAAEQRFEEHPWAEGDQTEPSGRVFALCQDIEGTLWVGSASGLAHLTLAEQKIQRVVDSPLSTESIRALLCDQDGSLWIGTDSRGVYRHPANSAAWVALSESSAHRRELRIHALLQDRQGRRWVASDAGLTELRLQSDGSVDQLQYRYRRDQPSGLGRGIVVSLMQSRDDTIWAGTWQSGVSLLNAEFNRILSFGSQHPATALLRDDAVRGVALVEGRLWVGSADGLFQFDLQRSELSEIAGTEGMTVNAIAPWNSAIWVGTRVGLRRFDAQGRAVPMTGLPEHFYSSRVRILHATDAALWVGVDGHGVYRVALKDDEPLQRVDLLAPIAFIAHFDAERVMIGAQDGLYWVSADGRQLLHVHRPHEQDALHSLPAPITNFLRGRDGRQWLASSGAGLVQLRLAEGEPASSAEFIVAEQRPANAFLNCLAEDAGGRIWVSTDGGISRFDPPVTGSALESESASGKWFNFDEQDGALPGYFFSSIAYLPDGRFAFGGGRGFTLLDPGHAGAPRIPPAVRLNALWLNNQIAPIGRPPLLQALSQTADLHLDGAQLRSLALSYGAAEFINPQRLMFAYRMDPFDSDWIVDDQHSRRALYTNLAPGDYRFRVRSGNVERGWSEQEALLAIRIDPPWWGTWWFRTLAILSLATLLHAIYRSRVRWVQRRQRWLEEEVKLRTTELEQALESLRETQRSLIEQEKMASLGSLVAGVAHEINTPLGVALTAGSHLKMQSESFGRHVQGGKLTRSALEHFVSLSAESAEMICRNLERAAKLVQSFKQVSVDRTSEGRRRFDLSGFLNELVESSRSLWRNRAIKVQVQCPERLTMDSFPGPLGQVITNLIQNALMHAFEGQSAGIIQIEVGCMDEDSLRIDVIDDGLGMPDEVLSKVFEPFFTTKRNQGGTGLGLHVVFNLVSQKLGGRIELQSSPQRGTRCSIELPRVAPGLVTTES
ncbi:sensor histidine kinase [Pseudomarimonas arenosa]|uniref:histidine kinase n=1 Tax=Pseudomarimonas arenosa TaxID=2774145 RepID=A0AAW3ZMU3_9GAMM|nr:sensor histidine kinase [Pseudomarimonas arenosa]MBD8526397.1 hypothetical protein [Pseudomarimonas arenosa]